MEQREERREGLAGNSVHWEARSGRGVGLPMKTRREKMCQAFSDSVVERLSDSLSCSELLFMMIMDLEREAGDKKERKRNVRV